MIQEKLKDQLYRLILNKEAQRYALAVKQGNEIKYPHQKDYLSEADLTKAIKGEASLGVMLIQDKSGLCKAGCLDIDCPRDAEDLTEGLALAQTLKETAKISNLRTYIEFSGNRGYHLWILAKKAITASLMQSVLKTIAKKANFDCKEYFPNKVPTESKCIKLPCSIHLKSNQRCGFIGSNFNPDEPQIDLDSQAELMADFVQNEVKDLTAITNSSVENLTTGNASNFSVDNLTSGNKESQFESNKNQSEIKQKLNSFGSNHPSCISYLINNGSPLEIDYNQANLTLIRYCISREIEKKEAISLAESMAKNTSSNHPTSKDHQGKVSNFKSAYNSASRDKDNYQFNCSYILSNLKGQKLTNRGCIGSQCSLFVPKNSANGYQNKNNFNSQSQNNSNSSSNQFNSSISTNQNNSHNSFKQNNQPALKYYPLNRFLFEAMVNLTNDNKECCKSLILREAEKLIEDSEPINKPDNLSDSIRLTENEMLAYLIKKPEVISDCLEIFPEGFNALITKPLSEYFDYLANLNLPSEDTLDSHIDYIRERGIKEIASSRFTDYINEIKEAESVEVLNKNIDECEKLLKKSLNDKQIQFLEYHLPELVENLLSEVRVSISTPSPHLNHILNGGLAQGRLYVLGSPPANGKSTICSWIADNASLNQFKVVYASFEMSREQLFIASLARLSSLNSALIERKVFLEDNYEYLDIFKSRLFDAIKKYEEKIAPQQIIIEADESYTPNRLKIICKKVEADLLIVDYLQLMSSGDEKLDSAYQETLRVSKIATELKRLARALDIPIIAISDINKNAYLQAMSGGDLDMGALRDSFKIAHSADVILLLQSGAITIGKGDEKKTVNQLDLLAEKYPNKAHIIDNLKNNYPLNKSTADTYSRISIVKNRGGKLGEPCFRYARALHNFYPLNFPKDFDQDEQEI